MARLVDVRLPCGTRADPPQADNATLNGRRPFAKTDLSAEKASAAATARLHEAYADQQRSRRP